MIKQKKFSLICLFENKTKLFILISVILFSFLFLGGPDYYSLRSYKYAWNLGHIFLFFLLTYLLLRWQRFSRFAFIKQFTLILIFTLFMGVLTELLQEKINREPNIDDILKDLTGSLLAFAFFAHSRNNLYKLMLKILRIIVLIFVVLACWPLFWSLSDEYLEKKQFPVLSDFETLFEIKRWICKTNCTIEHKIAISGKSSLRVPLATTKYSGVSLRYFPNDWKHFSSLNFSVFNASLKPLLIYCRIHDLKHLANYQYSDRFNTKFTLNHGWNEIEISLEEVINAPQDRKIDLGNIHGFSIFVKSLTKPELIYIDNVRLKK